MQNTPKPIMKSAAQMRRPAAAGDNPSSLAAAPGRDHEGHGGDEPEHDDHEDQPAVEGVAFLFEGVG